jgi:1A family penicillin-binding protein
MADNRESGDRSWQEPTAGGSLGREPARKVPTDGGSPRRRHSRRYTWLAGGLVVAVLGVVVGALLWFNCGVRGCPDVNMLRGYMPDQASVLLDRNGDEVAKLFVTRRVVVPVDSIPEHTLNAFIAIEDRRFWSHGGVDWRRVLGAAWQNVRAGGVEEGSSTITMQLARNIFPEQLPANEKTLGRKFAEARMARQIESRYTKHEIMELYLNQIYFGSGAYGIQSASEEYFGKDAYDLTLAESALLAALPRAPSRLNPRANEEAALEGRELVLRRMFDQGLITAEQRDEAAGTRLVVRERRSRTEDPAPYFVEAVRRQLEQELGRAVYTEGYTIHTTLDLSAQRVAEQELSQQLTAIESGRFGSFSHRTYASVQADTARDRNEGTPYLQGAVVLMDARTGDVLALVGGRDYNDSEFNRATQAMRQPGSAFKPFVYAAAVASGYAPTHQLVDRPLQYALGNGQVWEPRNYDGSYAGTVTMRNSLANSRNIPTVRLANEVGMRRVLSTAAQFGLGDMPAHPSVVLGTAEVTPLRLTAAYAALATLGQRPEPRMVTRVVDRRGHVVWQQQPRSHRVIDPAAAFVTTAMLKDVVDRGTGTGVRAVGFRAPAAGKTGTTQDAADIWFVGYTPELVGTIWVGLDRRQQIYRGATGGQIGAPIWGRIMQQVATGSSDWSPPSGVETHQVDEAGVVASADCGTAGAVRTEYFVRGTAPTRYCPPPGYYAYGDTLGYYDYDSIREAEDGGWWDRLRRRFAREDSVRVAQQAPPRPDRDVPVGSPVDVRPVPGDTVQPPVRDTVRPAPRDTVRPAPARPDTTRRRPLGVPVRPGTGPGGGDPGPGSSGGGTSGPGSSGG